jgi:iron complex outermembrane receptor protein
MVRKSALYASVAAGFMASLLAPSGAAIAQGSNGGDDKIEEITVTSQRREEKLQTVPLAVTAFSPASLETQQINDTLDLAQFVPNMVAHNNTGLGSANTYYIRGLGNTESIATFDPPVGTYIDDVYIARQNLNNFALFDIDRIEVLRGPQGTLFGRNTTGGAIDIILKKPSDQYQGYVEAGYGKYSAYGGRASIDLPLDPKVLVKVSAFGHHDSGWATDVVTKSQLNFDHNWGARVAIRILPTDTLTWDIEGDNVYENYANYLNFVDPVTGERVSHSGFLQGGLAGLVYGGKANYAPTAISDSWAATSNLTWDINDELSISNISGYRQTEQQFANDFFDFPGSPAGGFTITNLGRNEQYSDEFKVNGKLADGIVSYVAGYYYFRENSTTDFADVFNAALIGLGPVFGPAPLILSDRTLVNSTIAHAVYTQWDFHATDELTLTAGARFTDEVKRFDINSDPVVAGFPNTLIIGNLSSEGLAAAGIPREQHSALVTPRFAAQYQVTPDLMFFASTTRGFKSGGWNARGESSAADTAFAPEKIWSEELGMRSEWFDKKLRLNVTGFYAYDEQIQIPAEELINGVATFNTTNPADMEIYGGEFEITALPTPDLTLISGIGVAHAEYTNISAAVVSQQHACHSALATHNAAGISLSCDAGFVDSTGNIADPVRVPDYTFSLTAIYNIDLGFMTVAPTATVSVEGAHAIGTAGDSRPGSDPKAYVGDEVLIDLGATFTPAAYPDVSFTAECKNCLENDYPVSLLPPNQFLNNPGIWDVKLHYKFGVAAPAPEAPPTPYAPPPVMAPAAPVAHSYMVFFDFNKSDLTPDAVKIVAQAAANAGPAKVTKIDVTGHTDTVGSDAYNMRLSRRRAESVAAELEKDGVPSSEIAIFAKGKHDLLIPTKDGVKEPQNRRVQIVYDGGAMS